MPAVTEIRCYIEEYSTSPGVLGLRLREKNTGRTVVLGTAYEDEKQQFVQFLLAGRAHRAALPALFDPTDPTDAVLISGPVESEDAATVTFIYDDRLSYLFS